MLFIVLEDFGEKLRNPSCDILKVLYNIKTNKYMSTQGKNHKIFKDKE